MFYLIENGIVKEKHQKKFPIAETKSLFWKESDNAIENGQLYNMEDNKFYPNPNNTIKSIKSQKLSELEIYYNSEIIRKTSITFDTIKYEIINTSKIRNLF
jgi:hypothetical protein